ncbi:unnamed protein product [Closterium sp. Naga37s-1]|nr:unnamed protein product [Closterium sp. Naga37s-1]
MRISPQDGDRPPPLASTANLQSAPIHTPPPAPPTNRSPRCLFPPILFSNNGRLLWSFERARGHLQSLKLQPIESYSSTVSRGFTLHGGWLHSSWRMASLFSAGLKIQLFEGLSMEAHPLWSVATNGSLWDRGCSLAKAHPRRTSKGERQGLAVLQGRTPWSGEASREMKLEALTMPRLTHGGASPWERGYNGSLWDRGCSLVKAHPLAARRTSKGERQGVAVFQGRTPWSGEASREMKLEALTMPRLTHGGASPWERGYKRISMGLWLQLGEGASPCSAADLQGRTPGSGGAREWRRFKGDEA